MSYFWREGVAIHVDTNRYDRPMKLKWGNKIHGVKKVTNRWTIDDGWWYQRTWRDYFKVVTDTGMLLIIFRDVLTDRWYIQRMYD